MPHLIIEYTHDAVTPAQLTPLVGAVHRAAIDSGLFEPGHVRTRAVPLAVYRHGGDDHPFMHAQLRIKAGRDSGQKKALSEAVLAAIRGLQLAARVVTVEVVDMDVASYAKYAV